MDKDDNTVWRGRERRSAARFCLHQQVRYRLIDRKNQETGVGQTVNISSRGLLFTTDHQMEPGEMLEVSVQWPAQLEDRCPLKLVTTGRVVRAEKGVVAASIERYEFRTQGSRNFTLPAAGKL